MEIFIIRMHAGLQVHQVDETPLKKSGVNIESMSACRQGAKGRKQKEGSLIV